MKVDLTDDDIIDIEEEIYEYLDEYLNGEILKLSSPNFYEEFADDVTNVIHDYWMDCGVCEDDDYDIVQEMVDNLMEVYLEISGIPMREYPYTSIVEKEPKNKTQLAEQIEHLKNLPQPAQKTKEWHEFRYNLITASNISKALSSEAQRNSLIYEKCKPLGSKNDLYFSNTEGTLHWGVKYEPVTVLIYEHMYNTKVSDFGCIQHPRYNFIGASPDGINTDPENEELYGRMLEVKNIYNREITGVPKEEYWVQTQTQMETCDLPECDFVETRFKEFENADAFHEDSEHEYKGVMLYFVKKSSGMSTQEMIANKAEMNTPVYKYMPVDAPTGKDDIQLWKDMTVNEHKADLVLFNTIYWYLDEFSCVLIQRNRQWFAAAVPIIEETWNTILKERVSGYDHRASKKRQPKTDIQVEKQDNDNSQLIRNLPASTNICLVKLDSDGEPADEKTIVLTNSMSLA
jgi:putative phage-type endonuclease